MYTDYYGFREKPFTIVPDPGYLYLSRKHSSALTHLQYGVKEGTGFILLTGEVGAGKTTLVKHLLGQLGSDIEVAVVFNTNVSADQLLEMVLSEFELEPKVEGKTHYLKMLNEFLIEKYGQGKRALLILDEAQNLSGEALEEIRMLSNLHSSKDLLLQIVLVGQPGLQTKLKNPSLYQLRQRITVSYHLDRLSQEEVEAYIAHRLKVAGGGSRRIFTPLALEAIFQYAEGIPRKTNILCDAALVYGFADDLKQIDKDVIEQVVKDGENTGLFTSDTMMSDGAQPEEGEGAVAPVGDDSVTSRINQLEEQVARLSSMLEMQLQEQKEQTATNQEKLVKKLTAMLQHERKKSDQLLVKYNLLRDRLNKQQGNASASHQNQTGRAPNPEKSQAARDQLRTVKELKTDPRVTLTPTAVDNSSHEDPIFLRPYYNREQKGKKRFSDSIKRWFKEPSE